MLKQFLSQAHNDQPVFISDVRAAFSDCARQLDIHITLYDGSLRRFVLRLPDYSAGEEAEFVKSYVCATLYNILSATGASRVALYASDKGLRALAEDVLALFQPETAKSLRSGYGKCLNVNERTLAALKGGALEFRIDDLKNAPAINEKAPDVKSGGAAFYDIPSRARDKLLLGMDIGGTDIKLAAACDGRLCAFKEYDWFPASFGTADKLITPILLLTRLMRAATSLHKLGKPELIEQEAMDKNASLDAIKAAAERMEQACGGGLRNFDGIGLCFPDVVVKNRIVGGETYKTRGMRQNPNIDYEQEFAKITGLCGDLKAYVTCSGTVNNINDGPMAAFTTAVEQAAGGGDVRKGFFAHTLGTELGTGWVKPDGSIPDLPLEVYNFIIDLGSFEQREKAPDDVRSVLNFNTGLAGTLQKYASQSGVFRLGAKLLPENAPEVYKELFDKGLFSWEGEKLTVPTQPKDMRKPCLEFFMNKAAEGDKTCREIFREVGRYMGVTWKETQYILSPETPERALYGRLVKNSECFALIKEGAEAEAYGVILTVADSGLANTPFMKQLAGDESFTVAQFAQAVGAVYYALA